MVFEDAPAELHSGSIRHRHVFHSAHAYLDLRANRTSSNIGGHSMISSVRDSGVSIQTQKPSASSSLKQIDEHNFAFTFGMPKPRRSQAELPPSLTTFLTSGVDVRGRTATDHMEVSYRFICSWEPFYEDEEDARWGSISSYRGSRSEYCFAASRSLFSSTQMSSTLWKLASTRPQIHGLRYLFSTTTYQACHTIAW